MAAYKQMQIAWCAYKQFSCRVYLRVLITLLISLTCLSWYFRPKQISVNQIIPMNQDYECSRKNSVWERWLAIECNRYTKTASTPEEMLQTFCKSIETDYTYIMPQTSTNGLSVYLANDKFKGNTTINVLLDTFDNEKKRKFKGFDLIVIWSEQIVGDGRASGSVINFKNGSYLGVFNIFWTGKTLLYVKIVSSVQNTCIQLKVIERYETTRYTLNGAELWIGATFKTERIDESTECRPSSFVFGHKTLCNFTSLNDGMSWFCGHPKKAHLNCSNIKSFHGKTSQFKGDKKNNKILYPGHVIFNDVANATENSHSMSDRNVTIVLCNERTPLISWKESVPTGFWLNGKWNFIRCYSKLRHTVNEYRDCLKNKTLILIGDSTIRQYNNYLRQTVLDLPEIVMLDTINGSLFHRFTTYRKYGINLMFFKHEMPLHFGSLPSKGIISIPSIIDSMRENKDITNSSIIILVGYYAHLAYFTPAIFRGRVRRLAGAIQRFRKVHPLTKVFFKGPHLNIGYDKRFDPRNALLFRLILEEEFTDILQQVTYLDTWDITVAHNSEYLHPKGDALKSQIHQLMAYIC